ncbi:hypothetical protein EVAR_28883_1 [Eumeta japonica]|uniref:Uncharacterized protein n=1 Tax=Eumeta variegata TaxID=151549 RepID=A0A4C1WZF6_EUMVA|nr:hypothetical protein EVAR_28883_1 [Eumeta japonica]
MQRRGVRGARGATPHAILIGYHCVALSRRSRTINITSATRSSAAPNPHWASVKLLRSTSLNLKKKRLNEGLPQIGVIKARMNITSDLNAIQ